MIYHYMFSSFVITEEDDEVNFYYKKTQLCASVISCSEWCDHETDMEVYGQDEMFQETILVPVPQLLNRLFVVLQPLHGWWLCSGEYLRYHRPLHSTYPNYCEFYTHCFCCDHFRRLKKHKQQRC